MIASGSEKVADGTAGRQKVPQMNNGEFFIDTHTMANAGIKYLARSISSMSSLVRSVLNFRKQQKNGKRG